MYPILKTTIAQYVLHYLPLLYIGIPWNYFVWLLDMLRHPT